MVSSRTEIRNWSYTIICCIQEKEYLSQKMEQYQVSHLKKTLNVITCLNSYLCRMPGQPCWMAVHSQSPLRRICRAFVLKYPWRGDICSCTMPVWLRRSSQTSSSAVIVFWEKSEDWKPILITLATEGCVVQLKELRTRLRLNIQKAMPSSFWKNVNGSILRTNLTDAIMRDILIASPSSISFCNPANVSPKL